VYARDSLVHGAAHQLDGSSIRPAPDPWCG
jgi:hypothetical protein